MSSSDILLIIRINAFGFLQSIYFISSFSL